MSCEIKINSLSDIQSIFFAAIGCSDIIEVADCQGTVADAKSILGLMALDCSAPVSLLGHPSAVDRVYEAFYARTQPLKSAM